MINPMQEQSQFSDEDLRKLAILLQQMPANEGLASINQDEAQLMKDYGGAAEPLPGTEGLGPDGGPVRSFFSLRKIKDTLFQKPKQDIEDAASGAIEEQQAEEAKIDKIGRKWNTKEEADAKNVELDTAKTEVEAEQLTSDTSFETWWANNKDRYAWAESSARHPIGDKGKDWIKLHYETARTKSLEAAKTQVPQMVETMNNFFATTDADGNKIYGENTTYEEFKTALGANMPANLSEATMRGMYANALEKFKRGEAFTLTPEEVAEFERTAIQTAPVADAEKVGIADFDTATMTDVGEVADVSQTEVDAIASITDDDIDAIFTGGIAEAEELLLKRVSGEAVSPAEVQLKQSVENNLRMLLGATVGGDVDPARVRQLKNIWADQVQEVTGKAAELRSAESIAAEKELVELYKGKSTMKLQQRLSNLEVERQTAFKNGDMELAGKLSNQQTRLTEVITQANVDTTLSEADLKSRTDAMIAQGTMDLGTTLANLNMRKETALAQGKTNLAISLSNLEKTIILATTNVKVAGQQRSMDDAVAIAGYKGEMALMGLEVAIDTEQMKSDLTKMGFELSRDLAELDAATQIRVAELTKQWREAQGDDQKQAAIYSMIGTALGTWAASDIRAKTNISPGAGEVESFLDALNSYKYEYKDPAGSDEAGLFVGVMAQDLEKTPMGASFVKDTPRGKQVDYGHGLAAILASQANLHDRLRNLEEG